MALNILGLNKLKNNSKIGNYRARFSIPNGYPLRLFTTSKEGARSRRVDKYIGTP